MVYNKRNIDYDIYEAGCMCVPKRTRKQRNRQQRSNEEMYHECKHEDSCLSADIYDNRKNSKCYEGNNRLNRKISGVNKKTINRSVQNLCSFSVADANLRCDTPIGKLNKKSFFE